MEITQYFRTVAEFANYSLDFLFHAVPDILEDIIVGADVPTWFVSMVMVSLGLAFCSKVWR